MVVLHVGFKVGCRSVGIEVSSNRFALSLEMKDKIVEAYHIPKSWQEKFHFLNQNCAM